MSQTGTIVSIDPIGFGSDWMVQYSYQLDAGGVQQAQIIVGNTDPPLTFPPYPARVAMWTSPTSTITVSPNPPGTTNPVVLACPDLIKAAAFGISIKGIPFQ